MPTPPETDKPIDNAGPSASSIEMPCALKDVSMACKTKDMSMIDDTDDEDLEDEDMWVEAFACGKQTDSEGATREWTAEDLKNIAERYNAESAESNPKRRMAPVVIGHPTASAPAYGWVEKAKVAGNTLKLKLGQLNDGFVQALKAGAYKTRSISLYPDLNIRHLGFLGAAQPAVPGLAPFAFAENDKSITYEYTEPEASMDEVKALKQENTFFKKLFDLFKVDVTKAKEFVEKPVDKPIDMAQTTDKGATMADKVATEKPVTDKPVEKTTPDVSVQFAEATTKITALEAELVALKATNEAQAKELGDKTVRDRAKGHREFCEALVAEGRMRPADVEMAVLNCDLRWKADSQATNFSQEKPETPTLDSYKSYMAAMPRVCTFEELAKPVAKPDPAAVQTAGQKVLAFCDSYMKTNAGSTFSQAFKAAELGCSADMAEYLKSEAFSDK